MSPLTHAPSRPSAGIRHLGRGVVEARLTQVGPNPKPQAPQAGSLRDLPPHRPGPYSSGRGLSRSGGKKTRQVADTGLENCVAAANLIVVSIIWISDLALMCRKPVSTRT